MIRAVPALSCNDQRTMLAQRVLAIAAGYEDLNDHTLSSGATRLLQTVTERRLKPKPRRRAIPWPAPRHCAGWRNRVDGVVILVRMAKVFVRAVHRIAPDQPRRNWCLGLRTPPYDPVHANQGRAVLPRVLRRVLLFAAVRDLRPGNCWWPICGRPTSTAPSTAGRFSSCWSLASARSGPTSRSSSAPIAEILSLEVVCDGATAMAWDYIVGLAKNAVLRRLARRTMITARWQYRSSGLKQRLFEEFSYCRRHVGQTPSRESPRPNIPARARTHASL